MEPRLIGRIDGDDGAIRASYNLRKIARAARTGGVARVAEALRVQETMTTSDFTHMADLIDRGVLQGYMDNAVPVTFDRIGYRRDTIDLARTGTEGSGRDYQINAPRQIPKVPEKGEYKPIDPAETYYTFRTYKYGCQFDISFEAWLHDNRDLGIIKDYPASWGMSARYTQQYVFSDAFANSTATFFTAGHGNLMSGAGSNLTYANLNTAITAITNFSDPSGNVSVYGGKLFLVVPPALKTTARALVDPSWLVANKIMATGNSDQKVLMDYDIEVVVDPFLPAVDGTYGNTAWYLFCDPRLRPAMRYGYLRGYDQWEIWVKDSDARALASGATDPFDGSFLTDDIAFKLRFFFGADQADWRGAYMSTGEAAA